MKWQNTRLPKVSQDLPQDFAAQVLSKAKSVAPDLNHEGAYETLRCFLEAEVSLLRQTTQHHRRWASVYHDNVALAEEAEIKIYQNILEQLPFVA